MAEMINNEDEINYLSILNNMFCYLQSEPLTSLSMLLNPFTLISICYEINNKSFNKLKENLTNNCSRSLVYSNLSNAINQMQYELVTKGSKENSIKINIIHLLNNDQVELVHLCNLLIAYSFLTDQNTYKEKINNFDNEQRENVLNIIKGFHLSLEETPKKEISISVETNNSVTRAENEDKDIKTKEILGSYIIQINELKKKNLMLIKENDILRKEMKEYIIREKENNEKYDTLLKQCEELQEKLQENENSISNSSFRSTSDTNQKWDLSEQEYLRVILKKDAEIERLKGLLQTSSNDSKEKYSEVENQRISEIEETYKKELEDRNKSYESEDELMSSALYNIGLYYQKLKIETDHYQSDVPSWLIKNRQQYYNGDS